MPPARIVHPLTAFSPDRRSLVYADGVCLQRHLRAGADESWNCCDGQFVFVTAEVLRHDRRRVWVPPPSAETHPTDEDIDETAQLPRPILGVVPACTPDPGERPEEVIAGRKRPHLFVVYEQRSQARPLLLDREHPPEDSVSSGGLALGGGGGKRCFRKSAIHVQDSESDAYA